jgi:thiol-disulfide isomerase/thioredoxin
MSVLVLLACLTGHPPTAATTRPEPVAPGTADVVRIDSTALTRTFTRASGAPRIVSLFATWCGPCAEELPMLQALAAARGVELTLVSVDLPAEAPRIAPYLRAHGITLPAYHYVDAALPTFLPQLMPGWARVLPVTLVVASDGTPIRRFDGLVGRDGLLATLP